jgi:hypothetical protein
VGQSCVTPCPQVPLPVPALKTPHENALVDGSGWAKHNYAPSEVNNYLLTVNERTKGRSSLLAAAHGSPLRRHA